MLVTVEAHLVNALGADSGRASVTFLGVQRIDVLRFGPRPDGSVVYATLGASRAPMAEPTAMLADPVAGPRVELVLALDEPRDSVLRALAVVAAVPSVEGLVLRPGGTVELGQPLWDGSDVTSVLLGEPSHVPDLVLDGGRDPVRFLTVTPAAGGSTLES
ncbi:suppressor of fused domain protein [Fodinicola feengrottensis]|uniref:Suppressor of fused domain protein n=1 Tax=Fodinicola feengrottensis TaxID=435914 RepID=A0ABN2IJD1_9ACTN